MFAWLGCWPIWPVSFHLSSLSLSVSLIHPSLQVLSPRNVLFVLFVAFKFSPLWNSIWMHPRPGIDLPGNTKLNKVFVKQKKIIAKVCFLSCRFSVKVHPRFIFFLLFIDNYPEWLKPNVFKKVPQKIEQLSQVISSVAESVERLQMSVNKLVRIAHKQACTTNSSIFFMWPQNNHNNWTGSRKGGKLMCRTGLEIWAGPWKRKRVMSFL